MLLDLLAEKVETLCSHKPDRDTVARFLMQRVVLRPPSPEAPPVRWQEAGKGTILGVRLWR